MPRDEIEALVNQAVYWGSSIPFVGDVFQAIDTHRYYSDYLSNRGLTWADVRYPARLSTGGARGALNYVSKNIERLYE